MSLHPHIFPCVETIQPTHTHDRHHTPTVHIWTRNCSTHNTNTCTHTHLHVFVYFKQTHTNLHTLVRAQLSTHTLYMYTCYSAHNHHHTYSPHTPHTTHTTHYTHTHHTHHTLTTHTTHHTHHTLHTCSPHVPHTPHHTHTTYTTHTAHILSSQSCNCGATPPRCFPQGLLPSNDNEFDLCPPRVVDLVCWQQWGIPLLLLHHHCGSLRTTPGLNPGY